VNFGYTFVIILAKPHLSFKPTLPLINLLNRNRRNNVNSLRLCELSF